MSYILDALRKSQAERQHRAPAGLDPVDLTGAPAALRRRSGLASVFGRHWVWWALVALLAAALAFVLLGLRPGDRSPGGADGVASTPPSPASADVSMAAAQRPSTAPTTPKISALQSPAPAAPAPPQSLAPPAAAGGTPTVPPNATVPEAETLSMAQAGRSPAGAAAAADRSAAKPAPLAAQAPPVRLQDLPEELRRDLPAFRVSGSIQSNDAESRLLLINGQVLRQGEALAPGCVLETISPEAAVFRWRELRISVALTP